MTVVMKRTADLLPLVLPYCPTCPEFLAEQMIRFAAVDLAERSRCWRHLTEVQVISSGLEYVLLSGTVEGDEFGLLFTVGGDEYRAGAVMDNTTVLIPPTAAVIHEIEFAEFDGQRLIPVQYSTLTNIPEGQPEYITQVRPNTVALVPFQPGTLRVSMFVKPAAGTEFGTDALDPMFDRLNVIPDFFITIHGGTIAAGALARILSIPGEPWTDEQKAMAYRAEFEMKLNSAFRWNMRGQQRAPIRTRYQDF